MSQLHIGRCEGKIIDDLTRYAYVIFSFGGNQIKTDIRTELIWNQDFVFDFVAGDGKVLGIEVWDKHEVGNDDNVGNGEIEDVLMLTKKERVKVNVRNQETNKIVGFFEADVWVEKHTQNQKADQAQLVLNDSLLTAETGKLKNEMKDGMAETDSTKRQAHIIPCLCASSFSSSSSSSSCCSSFSSSSISLSSPSSSSLTSSPPKCGGKVMYKLIKNANIITMVTPQEIRNGCIGIIDDHIDYVGSTPPDGDEYTGRCGPCEVIDADGAIVMPGLINAHTHIPMTLFRGTADDLGLHEWLFEHIFPQQEKLTPQDAYESSKLALQEIMESGTTCFCDMYFMSVEVVQAARESGLRGNVGTTLRCLEQTGDFEQQQDVVQLRTLCGNDKIKITVCPHAVYTNSPEFLRFCSTLGDTFHIHVSETVKENEDCVRKHGTTPTELLKTLGFLQKCQTTNCAHCVHLTDRDIALLAESGASVTHCPSSNLKLAAGIAPIPKYLASGINVALGTDSAASNNALDMFNEIRLAALLHKGVSGDPTAVPAQTVLQMATVNGARALGRELEIGRVERGYKADLIFIETKSANMHPLAASLASAVCYSASSKNVVRTMVGGNTLYAK